MVSGLSVVDAARAAATSPTYLSRLENNAVKEAAPYVLYPFSWALSVHYQELMRLSGYLMPGVPDPHASETLNAGDADARMVGSGGRTRTYDQAVNSRPLYH